MAENKFKRKNFAHINSNCKMAKLSDGEKPMDCPKCGTNHKLLKCPFCGTHRDAEIKPKT